MKNASERFSLLVSQLCANAGIRNYQMPILFFLTSHTNFLHRNSSVCNFGSFFQPKENFYLHLLDVFPAFRRQQQGVPLPLPFSIILCLPLCFLEMDRQLIRHLIHLPCLPILMVGSPGRSVESSRHGASVTCH